MGWYLIDPGASRKFVLPKNIHPSLAMDGTGYFAKSQPGPDQKTLYWQDDPAELKLTDQRFDDAQDQTYSEGWSVGFRKITLKWDQGMGDATAKINLKQ